VGWKDGLNVPLLTHESTLELKPFGHTHEVRYAVPFVISDAFGQVEWSIGILFMNL
jgi:hypothetical protein